MLTESNTEVVSGQSEASAPPSPSETKPKKKASSAHFKIVPESRAQRDRVRKAAEELAKTIDRSKPLTRNDL